MKRSGCRVALGMKYLLFALALVPTPAFADDPWAASAEISCMADQGFPIVMPVDGKLAVCFRDEPSCFAFANPTAPVTFVSNPGKPKSRQWELQTDHGASSLCHDGKCVKVGAKLAAEIQALHDPITDVTSDLSRAVLNETELWTIAKDVRVTPHPASGSDAASAMMTVEGATVLATWDTCKTREACTLNSVALDAAGKPIGTPFPGGDLVAVDTHHGVVVGTHAPTLTTLDTDTGKPLGHVDVVDGGTVVAFEVGRLDDATVGLVWRVHHQPWKIAWVSAPAGKPPTLTGTRSIANCE
jgi:hypothetical protein